MKGKMKYFVFVFALLLGLCGVLMMANPTQTVHAAEFTYQEGRDGFELTDNGRLKVTFTVDYMEGGLSSGLIKWGVYLIDPATGLTYNATTHKYQDNNNRQRYAADYYFLINPSDAYDRNGNQVTANGEDTYTIYVNPNAVAYHATSGPSSASDFGTNTGKTMEEVLHEKDWIIGVGPMFENWWASGYGAPIDYYVGRQSELIVSKIYFRDFDGTELTSKRYNDKGVLVDVSEVNFTPNANKVFKGWYCDVTNELYDTLNDVHALNVSDLMSKTNTVNFYATYQRGNGEYIEFTPVANYTGNYTQDSENDTILLDETNNSTTFSVVYPITHNDGVNSILLLPEFDTTVFSIVSVVVDNTTALGTATLTNNGFDKILLESENFYDDLNDHFITITFNIDNPTDGDYHFGWKLAPYIHNEVSEAYFYNTEELGEQDEIEIVVVHTNDVVRILTLKDAEIQIGKKGSFNEYDFTYKGATFDINRINFDSNFNTSNPTYVEYKYNGTADTEDIITKWYTKSGNEYTEIEAPVLAGEYYVGVSAPAHGLYRAVDTVYRRVNINKIYIYIEIDDKTSNYGDQIVQLTWSYDNGSGSVLEGDNLGIVLSTTATSSSNVGTYPITGSYNDVANQGKYYVTFYNGTYRITAKAITVRVGSTSDTYTGVEATFEEVQAVGYTAIYTGTDPEQSATELVEGLVDGGYWTITLSKTPGVNVGRYPVTATINDSTGNFTITVVDGEYVITSASGYDFSLSFEGLTLVYNAAEQNLLSINENYIPEWVDHYEPTDYMRKNVGTYPITITVYVGEQDAANHTNGETEIVIQVTGKINPYALTITADNNGHTYGSNPSALTPTVVDGAGEEPEQIAVTFVVKDGDDTITLAANTPVGEYSIVPSATNSNYTFTFVNGTYTVSKGTAVITVEANDVYYNRDFNYTVSVNVGTLTINNYAVEVRNSNNYVVDPVNYVLDAGIYTVFASVEGTDNYFGAEETDEFNILKIALANPTVSYDKATATWTAVTTDAGAQDVAAKALYNSTLTYSINNVEQAGFTYTATSTDALTLTVASSNDNYLPVEVNLLSVYSVVFNEGIHTANNVTPSNMPQAQFRFAGETADEPQTDPSLVGYEFDGWDYNFATPISENTTITALWDINSYTITFKYTDDAETLGTDVFTFEFDYNSKIAYAGLNLAPVKASDNAGISYTFNGEWVSNLLTYIVGELSGNLENDNVEYVVTGEATFVAQFTTNYALFTVTYHVRQNGGAYANYATPTEVAYGDEIPYESLSTNIHWFRANSWYLDENALQAVPALMPNHNIDVYGEIIFNIGQGDVNADGYVDANDITLYRQWIVGGYEMTVVASGNEWGTAQNFDSNVRYFLAKVADNNADTSKDIRDISITRMAIVGGYTWDNDTGVNVSGQEIIRNVKATTLNAVDAALRAGKKVTLANDITENEGILNITTSHNLYIDLNGKTLTVQSLSFAVTDYSTITIKNGTIVTTDGITISAPNGNVVLTDVTAYDKDGEINLAAANHSLHINGLVQFNKGTKVENTPAAVKVADGTHVVVEEAANLVVEKLVVAVVTNEEFVPTQAENIAISIDNFSAVADEIIVEGNVEKNNEIYTRDDLVAAAANGGNYVLMADLSYSGSANRVYFYKDTVIDLNGHTITSTNEIPLAVLSGATLTINGNGNVNGVEGCVMAFGNASFVINGGTYTCADNFVFGTNGSTGRGGNHITINAGTFNGNIVSNGYVACGIYVANSDTVVVNGGTFNITNGVGILARSGNTTVGADVVFNVTGDGHLGKVGDSQVTVPAGQKLVLDLKAGYPGGVPTINNNSSYDVYVVVDGTYTFANDDASFHAARGVYDNVILTGDFDDYLYVTKDMNIYLNGHTVDASSTSYVAIYVVDGAKVTINGNGNVIATEGCVMAFDGSEFVINGGTYTCYDNFVFGTNGSTGRGENKITVNAGTFNGEIKSAGYIACGIYVANDDVVVVNGGTFNITNGVGMAIRAGNIEVAEDVVFNVSGNTTGKVGDSRVVMPAGEVFVVDFAAEYPGLDLANFALVNNTEYEVVALVGNEAQLNNAINFADTVVMMADIELTAEVIVTRTVTLDLNGHKLFNDSVEIWSDDYWALIAVAGGHLTINGEGQLIAKENDCYVVEIYGEGTLVANGGTFAGNCHAVYVLKGTCIVNDGYFYVQQPSGNPDPYGYVLNCLDARYKAGVAHIIVNGGQFENFNPADCAAEEAHTNFVSEGLTVTSEVVDNKTIYTVA